MEQLSLDLDQQPLAVAPAEAMTTRVSLGSAMLRASAAEMTPDELAQGVRLDTHLRGNPAMSEGARRAQRLADDVFTRGLR